MGRHSEQVVLQESPDILRFAEKNIKREEDRLYPSDPEMLRAVQAWGEITNLLFVFDVHSGALI